MGAFVKLTFRAIMTSAAFVIGSNAAERVWKDVLEERFSHLLKRFKKASKTEETES